jgi:hypothetical protein
MRLPNVVYQGYRPLLLATYIVSDNPIMVEQLRNSHFVIILYIGSFRKVMVPLKKHLKN